MSRSSMSFAYFASPLGPLLLAAADGALRVIRFPTAAGDAAKPDQAWRRHDAALAAVKAQLAEYFAGRRHAFALPMAPDATPFQAEVLAALQAIPYGETRSYSDIARRIGRPKAVRAVGGANARNPLPIVIPCHRVIGAGGQLTGFGGGIEAKRYLLDLERRSAAAQRRSRSQRADTQRRMRV